MRKMLASIVMGGLLAGGLTTTASAGDLTKTYNSIDQGAQGWGDFGRPWGTGNDSPMPIDILVADGGIIESLDLVTAINFSHTWIGELTMTLEHVETGTLAVLLNRPGLGPFDDIPGDGCCGNSSDIDGNYSWTDTPDGNFWWPIGSPLNSPTAYDPRGFASYTTPLSLFAGEDKVGTWRLTMYDGAGPDLGAIQGWEITMTNVPAPGALALLGLAGIVSRRQRRLRPTAAALGSM